MNRPLIGVIVALAASGAALMVSSWTVHLLWRPIAGWLHGSAPVDRARMLALLRLTPATVGVMAGTLVLSAFARLEPANVREALGVVLPAIALATMLLIGARGARGVRAWRDTSRTVKGWASRRAVKLPGLGTLEARTVDTAYPVVAVVGIWRPRLFIARGVLAACDARELGAMIAHEAAHVAARDNLTRLLFQAAPFAGRRAASRIERAWTRASEEAADDGARHDAQSSLALASALTKVARLAASRCAPALTASAILSDSGIEPRVRRLLADLSPAVPARRPVLWLAPLVAALALALSPAALGGIYTAAEYCVRNLP